MLSSHIFNSSLHSSLPSFAQQQQPPQPPTRHPQSSGLCRNSSASHNPASRALSTKQPHRQLCSTTSLHLLPILPPTKVLTSPEPQVSNHNQNFPLPRTKQPHSKSKNGHPKTSNSGRQPISVTSPQNHGAVTGRTKLPCSGHPLTTSAGPACSDHITCPPHKKEEI